ncbi:MAG TPA: hypothetical protein VGK73_17815 [Polyangiaceae bacterium]
MSLARVPSARVLSPDVVSRSAALGVRFFDPVTKSFVADGLSVTATTLLAPPIRCQAQRNRSHVFVFHRLPGLARFEFSEAAEGEAFSEPGVDLRIEVSDGLDRFLPFSFEAGAPERGLFALRCVDSPLSPLADDPAVDLFSAPAREPGALFARVRAELWDPDQDAPAAWAYVEAQVENGPTVRGLADERGRVALFFAYPEPIDLVPGTFSRPLALSPPLVEQRWNVELAVHYAPERPPPKVPDLCSAFSRPKALLWADFARTVPLEPLELRFGRELVARTGGGARLWVTPA